MFYSFGEADLFQPQVI